MRLRALGLPLRPTQVNTQTVFSDTLHPLEYNVTMHTGKATSSFLLGTGICNTNNFHIQLRTDGIVI